MNFPPRSLYLQKQQTQYTASGHTESDHRFFNHPRQAVFRPSDKSRNIDPSRLPQTSQNKDRKLQTQLRTLLVTPSGAAAGQSSTAHGKRLRVQPLKPMSGMVNGVAVNGLSPTGLKQGAASLPGGRYAARLQSVQHRSFEGKPMKQFSFVPGDDDKPSRKQSAAAMLSAIYAGRGFLPNGARRYSRNASKPLSKPLNRSLEYLPVPARHQGVNVSQVFQRAASHQRYGEMEGEAVRSQSSPHGSPYRRNVSMQSGMGISRKDLRHIMKGVARGNRYTGLSQFLLDAFDRIPHANIDHETPKQKFRLQLERLLLRLEQKSVHSMTGEFDYMKDAKQVMGLFQRLSWAVEQHVRDKPEEAFDYEAWWKGYGKDESGKAYLLD